MLIAKLNQKTSQAPEERHQSHSLESCPPPIAVGMKFLPITLFGLAFSCLIIYALAREPSLRPGIHSGKLDLLGFASICFAMVGFSIGLLMVKRWRKHRIILLGTIACLASVVYSICGPPL